MNTLKLAALKYVAKVAAKQEQPKKPNTVKTMAKSAMARAKSAYRSVRARCMCRGPERRSLYTLRIPVDLQFSEPTSPIYAEPASPVYSRPEAVHATWETEEQRAAEEEWYYSNCPRRMGHPV